MLFSIHPLAKSPELEKSGFKVITDHVNQNDLIKYEGLAKIEGISVGTCIQANILQEDLIVSSVTILDACCCEI